MGAVVAADAPDLHTVHSWREQDGPWRHSREGQPLPVGYLQAARYATIPATGAVLAQWADGNPVLTQRYLGTGQLLLLSVLPDPTWSNLENLALHLVLVQRLLAEPARGTGGAYLNTITAGGAVLHAGLVQREGLMQAWNRPPIRGRRGTGGMSQQDCLALLTSAQLEVSADRRPQRPWLVPLLYLARVGMILEAVLQWAPWRTRAVRKEARYA